MTHIFIVNSISGKGKALQETPLIEKICQEKALEYEVILTEYEGHAREIAAKYSKEKDICIYSVGGDGTLLEIINGIEPSIPLGIIPCGSGNDFYRYFGGSNFDFEKIIGDTIDAETTKIDIGIANGLKFINTTSIGADAKINIDASYKIRNTFLNKGAAYITSIIQNLFPLLKTQAIVNVDGNIFESNFLIISCMNGKFYGNGIKAAPLADISDQYLDFNLIPNMKGLSPYIYFLDYTSGKHDKIKQLKSFRCKHVHIESDNEMYCQSDGENYKTKVLDIQILEQYLNVKIPSYLLNKKTC